jgi:hypothetical protein
MVSYFFLRNPTIPTRPDPSIHASAAIKELLDTSEIMTSGEHFTAENMERFNRSKVWAKRVITLAENSEKWRDNSQIPLF